ncbi:MAG: 1,2-phenylacetyl-CoA epoxidase subunit PaaC [Pseudomonadota bacterium]
MSAPTTSSTENIAQLDKAQLFDYILRLGDTALILGQRLSAWCGHAPALEEDIAVANTALDLIGQAKNWLSLAGDVEGQGRTADDLAYLRDERRFRNALLVEQPNGDFGQTLMRQFLFDVAHYHLLDRLKDSTDQAVSEIAQKSIKEVAYHLERSTDLIIRLGDGTEESHRRMQDALDKLWRFTGELMTADELDIALWEAGVAPDMARVKASFDSYTAEVFRRAHLELPEKVFMRKGGKTGVHSEHMGPLLAEMQSLHRAHPGAKW